MCLSLILLYDPIAIFIYYYFFLFVPFFLRIIPSFSHLRVHVLQRSDHERQVVLLIVILCELAMDVLRVRLLAVEAHIAASCDVHENFDAIATQHHRKRIEVLRFEGNRHRKIVRKMSL